MSYGRSAVVVKVVNDVKVANNLNVVNGFIAHS
jgi:hypothetical protein